jgi:hypothetical protein
LGIIDHRHPFAAVWNTPSYVDAYATDDDVGSTERFRTVVADTPRSDGLHEAPRSVETPIRSAYASYNRPVCDESVSSALTPVLPRKRDVGGPSPIRTQLAPKSRVR